MYGDMIFSFAKSFVETLEILADTMNEYTNDTVDQIEPDTNAIDITFEEVTNNE